MRCGLIQKHQNKQMNPEFSHAVIFVFDCSEMSTFNIVKDYIEAYIQIEESKYTKIDSTNIKEVYRTRKVIL